MKSILLLTAFNTTLSDGLQFLLENLLVFPSADVTPDAVDWANINSSVGGPYGNNIGRLTGITQSVNLRINYTGAMTLQYKSSNDALSINYMADPTGWATISNNGTVSIVPQNYLGFVRLGTRTSTETVTVTNLSDNNTVLDTFTATMV